MFTKLSLSCQIPHLNEIYAKYFSEVGCGTFVEVGGNDGYSWSNTWGLAEAGWRGLYFEPVEALAIKCREKHLHNHVKVIPCAVGSHDGVTKLYQGEGATTSEFVAKNNTFFYGNSEENFTWTILRKLDTILAEEHISHSFELLVIDVDGDEVEVLKGINLAIWQPRMIIIETCKDHVLPAWRFNAAVIEAILCRHYDEVYYDHINSIYIRRGPVGEGDEFVPSLADLKRDALLSYASKFNLRNFVETGTLFGDMVAEMVPHFEYLYSVELSEGFYRSAVRRFRDVDNVIIFQGDSGSVLGDILPTLEGPSLFFLDAHYCGGNSVSGDRLTPILAELKAILGRPLLNGIILIDDLKSFKSDPAYPNFEELSIYSQGLHPGITVEMTNDGEGMILITPSKKERQMAKKLPVKKPVFVKHPEEIKETVTPKEYNAIVRNRPEIQSEGRPGLGPEIPEITWPDQRPHKQAVNQAKQSGRRGG